jgi:hypothetical protein
VKRGTLLLTVVAGVLVFLGVLVLYLPASWFTSMLPPQARCAELGGSIWHGECLGLTYQGGRLGDATWNLAPLSALTGRLVGDADIRGALTARADLDLAFDGTGELRNLKARFAMDPTVFAQFPAQQRGHISVDLKRLVLGDSGMPSLAEGTVELRDFRQVGLQPPELGSYSLTFDGKPRADGSLVGQLRDLGGPFALEGTLTLSPPNQYQGAGRIAGRTAEAEGVVRQITFGAPPDASGRAPFTLEGTF